MVGGCRHELSFMESRWHDDTGALLRRRGWECSPWSPWTGAAPSDEGVFESCSVTQPVPVWGHPAHVVLYRQRQALVGVWLSRSCDAAVRAELLEAARRATGADGAIREDFSQGGFPFGGKVQRFETRGAPGATTCVLLLTDDRFGPAFARRDLASGLNGLFRVH